MARSPLRTRQSLLRSTPHSPGELRDGDAAVLSSPLYPCDYEIGLVYPFPRSENPFRISENSDCQFFRISVNLIN